MSNTRVETRQYTQQMSLLSALTPGHMTRTELTAQLTALNTPTILASTVPSGRFNNLALFDTDCYRAEVLRNVDKVLEQYQGDFITPNTDQVAKVEKDLLWASLQLFAHLQAVEQEVGLILMPKTEYAKSLQKLEACKAGLSKNGSDTTAIDFLLQHKPLVTDVENGAWYEKAFKVLIQEIDDRNNTRLFWVWGRPNLDLALEYAGQDDARTRLAGTTFIPGQISWSLYLFRGSLFALKLFNVWWNNPKWLKEMEGLSIEERAALRLRYLIAYWDVYKYRILNDYVWGPINLFSLKWWTGWFGDFATCFLLCMDLYLADLTFAEEEKKYVKNQQQYMDKYAELSTQIFQSLVNGVKKNLLHDQPNFDDLQAAEKIIILNDYFRTKTDRGELLTAEESALVDKLSDLNDVHKNQQDHAQRWQKKSTFLWGDCIYTKALLVAFAMCVSLLIGGYLPVALAVFLTKSGTVLCLALTILYRTVRAQVEISQAKEERKGLQAQEVQFLEEFWNLKANHLDAPNRNNEKKMHDLYLHIVNMGSQINYQSASIQYQYLDLARTSLMRGLIPTLIGLTLVYAPATLCMIPTYVFTLAVSAALAYALDQAAKMYKPDEVKSTSILEPSKYHTFFAAPRVFSDHAEDSWLYTPSSRAQLA